MWVENSYIEISPLEASTPKSMCYEVATYIFIVTLSKFISLYTAPAFAICSADRLSRELNHTECGVRDTA